MTEELKKISLGPEAIAYIRQILGDGKTLARLVLRRPDLDDGRVITFLPPDVTEKSATEFTSGGKLPQQRFTEMVKIKLIPNTRYALIPIIQSYLTGGEYRLCIFENACAEPSDPSLRKRVSRILTYQNEVYHYLTKVDVQGEEIERTVREAETGLLIGVMTYFPKGFVLSGKTPEITSGLLDTFAERTEKIIVGAYDFEGYLIWNKP